MIEPYSRRNMKNEHVEKNYDGYRSLPDDILTGSLRIQR